MKRSAIATWNGGLKSGCQISNVLKLGITLDLSVVA